MGVINEGVSNFFLKLNISEDTRFSESQFFGGKGVFQTGDIRKPYPKIKISFSILFSFRTFSRLNLARRIPEFQDVEIRNLIEELRDVIFLSGKNHRRFSKSQMYYFANHRRISRFHPTVGKSQNQ
ncbi:hypothetical protein A4A43_09780 [Bacillus licheniformis]|nr:hypothetical protein A4A43_09780 [Bacillus licheniformis]OIS86296.1 hypothetical protein A4A40_21090 [Bacillus licheniformis]